MIQYQQSLSIGVNAFIVCLGFCLCAVGALCALSLACSIISAVARLLTKIGKED